MPNHFGRSFNNIENDSLLTDIETLENQGCIYNVVYNDEIDGPSLYRIEFNPDEIFRFVEAMYAYEEFRGFVRQGYSPEEALGEISSQKIRDRVKQYNEWAEENDAEDQQFSPAAFYGTDIETLLTGGRPDRQEMVPQEMFEALID